MCKKLQSIQTNHKIGKVFATHNRKKMLISLIWNKFHKLLREKMQLSNRKIGKGY